MKSFIKNACVGAVDSSRILQRIVSYIARNSNCVKRDFVDSYPYLRERFIENGKTHRIGSKTRLELIRKFELIDQSIQIASSPTDGLFLAEILFNVGTAGEIVECGCFSGGSSSKLSLLAEILDRKFIVFDSFEGLPSVDPYYLRDQHCRRSNEWVTDWEVGRYTGRLEQVQENISKFGCIARCQFVKGWFADTLNSKNIPSKVAFVFSDVDLANSAKDCFVPLWSKLENLGIFVTHDTAYIKVLQEFYNPQLWRDVFKSFPPVLFGAGFGLCNDSPHMGYMVKGDNLDPEYLKSLTIDK